MRSFLMPLLPWLLSSTLLHSLVSQERVTQYYREREGERKYLEVFYSTAQGPVCGRSRLAYGLFVPSVYTLNDLAILVYPHRLII